MPIRVCDNTSSSPLEAFPPNCGTYGWIGWETPSLFFRKRAWHSPTSIPPQSSPHHYFVCPPPSFLPSLLLDASTANLPSANQAVNAEPQLDNFPPFRGAQHFDCPQRGAAAHRTADLRPPRFSTITFQKRKTRRGTARQFFYASKTACYFLSIWCLLTVPLRLQEFSVVIKEPPPKFIAMIDQSASNACMSEG